MKIITAILCALGAWYSISNNRELQALYGPAGPEEPCNPFNVFRGDLSTAQTIVLGENHNYGHITLGCLAHLMNNDPRFKGQPKTLLLEMYEGDHQKALQVNPFYYFLVMSKYWAICIRNDVTCKGWDVASAVSNIYDLQHEAKKGKLTKKDYTYLVRSMCLIRNSALWRAIEHEGDALTFVIAGSAHVEPMEDEEYEPKIDSNSLEKFTEYSLLVANRLEARDANKDNPEHAILCMNKTAKSNF